MWFGRYDRVCVLEKRAGSDSRRDLRDFFEVDARYVTLVTLTALAREGEIAFDDVEEAMHDLEINPAKANPMIS